MSRQEDETPSADPIAETSRDAFLGGALVIEQPRAGYRAGLDPVLLAAACPAAGGVRALDCGAGVGTVGLCAARRLGDLRVTMVERDPSLAALARANVAANALDGRVDVVEADLAMPLSRSPTLHALAGTFDHALANPPYHDHGGGTRSGLRLRDEANAMAEAGIEAWVRFLAAMLRPGGTLTLIHRAAALGGMLAALDGRFGAVEVLPVQPRVTAPAHRILMRAIKASRAPMSLLAPLIVHEAEGQQYHAEVQAVLRQGAALARFAMR